MVERRNTEVSEAVPRTFPSFQLCQRTEDGEDEEVRLAFVWRRT